MRGRVWDKLELQLLHGFIAATRRRCDGGTVGASERGWYETFVAATKKARLWRLKNRKHTSSFLSNKKLFHLGNMEK
jgi:hypothetical protein